MLEVKNLTKYYDISGGLMTRLSAGLKLLKAVDHIDFSVPEGKTFLDNLNPHSLEAHRRQGCT